MQILPVTPDDKAAILALFALDKKIWPSGVGQNWYWYWREHSTKEDWVKVVDDGGNLVGSAHWSTRRDGTRNLKDIIVHPSARGRGIGRMLVEHIQKNRTLEPVQFYRIILKTDHDSDANAFYQRLGFVKGDTLPSKSGTKLLTNYSLGAS